MQKNKLSPAPQPSSLIREGVHLLIKEKKQQVRQVMSYRPTAVQVVVAQLFVIALFVVAYRDATMEVQQASWKPQMFPTLPFTEECKETTPEPVRVNIPEKVLQEETIETPQSDYAPVAVKSGDSKVEAYIARFAKTAQEEQAKFGIPASISLAQGIIESRSGTSKLAVQNNNHFGIKCHSKSCPKGHCTNHHDDSHKDFFRKFNTAWESWREHSKVLTNTRYTKRVKNKHSYKEWAYALKAGGYATDRKYAEKLIGVITRYKLYQYDTKSRPSKMTEKTPQKSRVRPATTYSLVVSE